MKFLDGGCSFSFATRPCVAHLPLGTATLKKVIFLHNASEPERPASQALQSL
jgi:hypothetical protein